MHIYVDFFTTFVAAILFMIFHAAWYSDYLFGNLWKKAIHLQKKHSIYSYVGVFMIGWIIAYFIGMVEFFLKVTSFWDGVLAGFIIWLGFILPALYYPVVWGKRRHLPFFIEVTCFLLQLMVMGGVIAG